MWNFGIEGKEGGRSWRSSDLDPTRAAMETAKMALTALRALFAIADTAEENEAGPLNG